MSQATASRLAPPVGGRICGVDRFFQAEHGVRIESLWCLNQVGHVEVEGVSCGTDLFGGSA